MLGMADLSLASILSKAMNTAALQKRWPPEHKEEI
jgi:hypothetical protein